MPGADWRSVIWGMDGDGKAHWQPEEQNDRMDMRSSDVIVLWASNPAWSRAGLPNYQYLQCRDAGVKFICVDPFYTPTARALTDDYIPIRPGTDSAMLLGMAYVLISQDDPSTNPLIDWDFLERCTIGSTQTICLKEPTERQLQGLRSRYL